MKKLIPIAIFFIAAFSISTRASAEEVYRCGSNYSQKPCPGAVAVDVDDSRSPAQKAEADAKTRHETAQVKALEKEHHQEEVQRRADHAKLAMAQAKKADAAPGANPPVAKHASAGKGKKKTVKSRKEPEFFVASTAATKPKSRAKPGK